MFKLSVLFECFGVMVVTVTATTTAGKALSGELLQKVEAGCDMALQLDEDKQQVSCLQQSASCTHRRWALK
jgi:hypothetical protein